MESRVGHGNWFVRPGHQEVEGPQFMGTESKNGVREKGGKKGDEKGKWMGWTIKPKSPSLVTLFPARPLHTLKGP